MDFIKDGLFGLAVGEAFGVELDMEDRNLTSKVTTMQAFRAYDCDAGNYSDDTSMLLAYIDSFIKNKKIDYKDQMDNLCLWVNENKYSSSDYLFDISKTIRLSLMNYWSNKDYESSGLIEEKKQDASFLSRIFLLNIIYSNKKIKDEEIINILRNIIKTTHNNEISFLGGFIAYKYTSYIISGKSHKEALILLKRYKYEKYFSEYSIDKFNNILKSDIGSKSINTIKSDAYIVSILESVFFILSNVDNYRDAVISSTMLGGANGVRASITGLYAGLIYGYKNINKDWLKELKRKDYLNKMIRKLKLVLSM